jgi:IclR family KDG regulon transcriptional repressor
MVEQPRERRLRGESTYHTLVLSRAFQILGSYTVHDSEVSVAELYERLGIYKSTLERLLQCLMDSGFIEQNPETGQYRLGIKAFEIGSICRRVRMMNIGALARPCMMQLVAQLNLSANLAVRSGPEIVYVETVEPAGSPLRVAYSAGDRFGVHHTALGKAMIAFLPTEELQSLLEKIHLTPLTLRTITAVEKLIEELWEVRKSGYAVDDEESLPGLRCVGAPIWDSERVVAALSASGSTLVVTNERVAEIAQCVLESAREVSAQLGR